MKSNSGIRLTLLVEDYDKAIAFYCEQTHLFSPLANVTIGPSTRNVVLAFADSTPQFCLVLFRVTNPEMSALVGRQAGCYPLLVLPVDDCVGSYERLKKAGVTFEGEPIRLPYGCQATLIDPFGNKVCLAEMY